MKITMKSIKYGIITVLIILMPFYAPAQQPAAEQGPPAGRQAPAAPKQEPPAPFLNSTGLTDWEVPEEILPGNAILYIRANNLKTLLENVDSLLSTFTPEKSLPPEIREVFSNPKPFISFFTKKAFGKPLPLDAVSELFGLDLSRPACLAFYPAKPKKGFILSVPISDPAPLSAMVQNFLIPETMEKESLGEIAYYHVVPGIGFNYVVISQSFA